MRAALVTVAALALVVPAGPADAAPSAPPGLAHEEHSSLDLDNRPGRAVPSARQRSLAGGARFNALGTPSALGPATLATGLPADPEAAARAYLAASEERSGWTGRRSPRWSRCWCGRSAPAPWSPCGSASATCRPRMTAWSRCWSATARRCV
ncbi:hypothetical protein WEI85_11610 [Actinomycetes bacterium KLBMP 9797]